MTPLCSVTGVPRWLLFAALTISSFCGCDKGLGPLNEVSGFGGHIRFHNWPPADSVRDLRVVAFTEFPADSGGILAQLIAGRANVYPQVGNKGLPLFQDDIAYNFTTEGTTLQPGVYQYVVLAQQYGPNIFTDWKPAAVYTLDPATFQPAPVRVLLHKITPGIDLDADFHRPPPKPWR
jgi:hypothetical protein